MSFYANCLGSNLLITEENKKKAEADGLDWKTIAADANLIEDYGDAFYYDDSCKYGSWVEESLEKLGPYLEKDSYIVWIGEDFHEVWGYTIDEKGELFEYSRRFNPFEYLGMRI